MRLTLRTLLAYLDDTLEPSQAKLIGQKIAESESAQELVARIKEVVRRRRLTTPPATGPGARLDANTVAEYIDSVLTPEQLAEVEEVCLKSDVHLAEIAACHQILTVVLSEPELVPPTARQRMYGLIRGREAIPYRKPASGPNGADEEVSADGSETDEALLLGLPSYSGQGRGFWRLAPFAGVVLLILALALAIWQALPSANPSAKPKDTPVAKARPEPIRTEEIPTTKPPEPAKEAAETAKEPATSAPETKPAPVATIPPAIPPESKPPANVSTENAPPAAPPRQNRRTVGTYFVEGNPTILIQQQEAGAPWTRLVRENPIFTADRITSLPGYRSDISLDRKVHLVLWGDIPDGSSRILMLESAVVLHDSPDVDLDLTLETGRISIANRKPDGPALVRVRFHDQIWELALQESRTEVAMELLGLPDVGFNKDPSKSEGPIMGLGLFALQGQATLKIRYDTYRLSEPRGPAQVIWNNLVGVRAPQLLEREQLPPWALRLPPRGKEGQAMRSAEEGLANRMNGKTPVELVLQETQKEPEAASRILGVYGFGATDDLPHLLDALANEKHAEVRLSAIAALRHWIGRRAENDQKLYQVLQKKYKSSLAEIIMELLHPFTDKQKQEPETYETLIAYLNHDKLPVRELAYSHLIALVPRGMEIPYDPTGGTDQRDYSYQEWKKLIPTGKLPPSPSQKSATPASRPNDPNRRPPDRKK